MRARAVLLSAILGIAACSSGSAAPAATAPGTAAVSASPAASAPSAVTAAAHPAYSGPACGWRRTTTYRHVVWIWMENRTYTSVLGSGNDAPRLSSYAKACGVATNYKAITHPSLPNYLAATSGSTGGVTSDCGPSQCPQKRDSLFAQLQRTHQQWRGYAESMPGKCVLASSGRYAARHNPAVYYTPVRTQCRTWDVPMGGASGAFATALADKSLPAFSFVAGNLCDDGHDCSLSTADSWLGGWLKRIVSSPAYGAGDTAVFVTWDEGVGSDQHIATVVLAPTVPRGTRSGTAFTHYSLLRTTEQLLGVSALGAAGKATSMRTAFKL